MDYVSKPVGRLLTDFQTEIVIRDPTNEGLSTYEVAKTDNAQYLFNWCNDYHTISSQKKKKTLHRHN